jgi:hypothetical protein
LGHSLAAWLTGSKPPWTLEAEEAEAEAAEEAAGGVDAAAPSDEAADPELDTHSVSFSLSSAVQLRNAKRRLTAFGVLAVYVVWASFAWCAAGRLHALVCVPLFAHAAAPALLQVHLHLCVAPLEFCAAHVISHNAPARTQTACLYIN